MSNETPPTQATKRAEAAAEPRGGTEADSLRDVRVALRTEQKKLALVQEVGRALSAGHDLDQLLNLIMEKVTLLMEADRSTLFVLSDDRKELWSTVLQGGEMHEIRLKVGEGIAGWVASSGETVNIPDAYIDRRFQPAVDLRSGYRTRSILCAPMRNSLGSIIGVAQVLNKNGGPFTAADEELLSALSGQAAIAIENSKLYHSVVAKNVELLEAQEKLQQKTYELNVLYEIEQQMNAADDLDELLERILPGHGHRRRRRRHHRAARRRGGRAPLHDHGRADRRSAAAQDHSDGRRRPRLVGGAARRADRQRSEERRPPRGRVRRRDRRHPAPAHVRAAGRARRGAGRHRADRQAGGGRRARAGRLRRG